MISSEKGGPNLLDDAVAPRQGRDPEALARAGSLPPRPRQDGEIVWPPSRLIKRQSDSKNTRNQEERPLLAHSRPQEKWDLVCCLTWGDARGVLKCTLKSPPNSPMVVRDTSCRALAAHRLIRVSSKQLFRPSKRSSHSLRTTKLRRHCTDLCRIGLQVVRPRGDGLSSTSLGAIGNVAPWVSWGATRTFVMDTRLISFR
jgi:hypothetical protein